MMLFMRLRGPLQGWATTTEHRTKSTQEQPTKAGVLGICCSALGHQRGSREESEFLRKARTWKMTTWCQIPLKIKGEKVRANSRLIEDYQTIGPPNPKEGLPGATTKVNMGTPRRKYCLADSDFVVGLEAPEDDLHEVETALKRPKWPLFLGRKHYVPSEPILIEVLEEAPEELQHGTHTLTLKRAIKIQESGTSEGSKEVFDNPTTFLPSAKAYSGRFVGS